MENILPLYQEPSCSWLSCQLLTGIQVNCKVIFQQHPSLAIPLPSFNNFIIQILNKYLFYILYMQDFFFKTLCWRLKNLHIITGNKKMFLQPVIMSMMVGLCHQEVILNGVACFDISIFTETSSLVRNQNTWPSLIIIIFI